MCNYNTELHTGTDDLWQFCSFRTESGIGQNK